jgi:hypothetical protein
MKINDSTYSTQLLQATKSRTVQQQGSPGSEAARVEKDPENQSQSRVQSRLDVSENAIALAKEQYAGQSSSGNASTQSNNQSNFSQYDEPSKQNQTAVAAYNTVDTLAQRENIKQVFGVNLFA